MNLWADLDKQDQQLLATAGQGRLQRMRRLTEHAIFSGLREWLLQEYVSAYCRSLAATRIFRRCYWIDALGLLPKAKGAISTPVEQEAERKGRKKGSPQIIPSALYPIVTLSQTLAQESRPISLYGLVLEAGSSRKASRNGAIKPVELAMPRESGLLRANWLEVAPLLLKEIEASPAIFLLNPFGLTLFSYDDLVLLYQRTVPTELCLLIPHKQLEMRLLKALNTPAQATELTALLRSDRWRALPNLGDIKASTSITIEGFIDLFLASMQRFFPQVQRIALAAQTGPALVEALPYTLIFATRRQDSLLSMNDAVCSYRRQISAQSHQGLLGEEWFTAQDHERHATDLQTLAHDALQQGKALRIRRWPDLRQKLLPAYFGQFTQSEYDAIIRQLLERREVRCEWRKPSAESEEERVPGNDDTLFWK